MKNIRLPFLTVVASLCVGLVPPSVVHASTFTWTGGATANNFSNASNWGGTAPVPGTITDYVFSGTTPRLNPQLDQPGATGDWKTSSITFSSGAASYNLGTVAGGSASFLRFFMTAGSTITQSSANNETISAYLLMPGSGTVTINGAGAGALTLAGFRINGGNTLDIAHNNTTLGVFSLGAASDTVRIEPGMAVTFSDTSTGAVGTLKFNVDTGGNAGVASTIQASNASGFTSTAAVQSNDVTFAGSKAMNFSGAYTQLGIGNETDTFNNTGGTTLSGTTIQFGAIDGTSSRTITLATGTGATGTLSGAISGSSSTGTTGLLISGSGTVILSGANTYNGGTTINSGTLQIGNTTALGATSHAAVTFGSGSTGTLTLAGISTTLTDLNTNATVGSPVIQNNNAANATLTVNTTNSDSYAGVIQNGSAGGTLALTKAGTGALTLSKGNTYSGGTTVSGGTLVLGNGNTGSATGTGALSVGATAALAGTGTSSGSSFSISGTTGAGNKASVYVGQTAATGDTNVTNNLTLKGSGTQLSGTISNISNANLTFNLNTNSTAGLPGQGNELLVGSTGINFGSNVTLTLNLQGSGSASTVPYFVLIAGTTNTGGGGQLGSQYTGLTLGTSFAADGGTLTPITGSTVGGGGNLQLLLDTTNYSGSGFYGTNNPGLFLYQANGIDDIVVIPEPGAWALMLGGLAVLIFWQRRKSSYRA